LIERSIRTLPDTVVEEVTNQLGSAVVIAYRRARGASSDVKRAGAHGVDPIELMIHRSFRPDMLFQGLLLELLRDPKTWSVGEASKASRRRARSLVLDHYIRCRDLLVDLERRGKMEPDVARNWPCLLRAVDEIDAGMRLLEEDEPLTSAYRQFPAPGLAELLDLEPTVAGNGPLLLLFPLDLPVQPTPLGNVEAALADRLRRRYGLELMAAWPRLSLLIPEEEKTSLVESERLADAAVHRAAGWYVAAATALFYGLVTVQVFVELAWAPVLLSLLAGLMGSLLFAQGSHREAVGRTVLLCERVESAVDLHRLELLDVLGWRRPASTQEEKETFRVLSRFLAGGLTTEPDDRRRHDGGSLAPGDVVGIQEKLGATIAELPELVGTAVERSLDEKLSGPPMINYKGFLSVALLDGTSPVPVEDGSVRLALGRAYQLVVRIQPTSAGPGHTLPLLIRNGEDRDVVPFAVELDSNLAAARHGAEELAVTRGGTAEVVFPLAWPSDAPSGRWLWIRVAQNSRTIQNLSLAVYGSRMAGKSESR
jgi:hypothetical protein